MSDAVTRFSPVDETSSQAFTFERSPTHGRKSSLAAGSNSNAAAKYVMGSPVAASGRRASFDQASIDAVTARSAGRRGSITDLAGSGRRGSIDAGGRSPALPPLPSMLEIPDLATSRSGQSMHTPTAAGPQRSRRSSIAELQLVVCDCVLKRSCGSATADGVGWTIVPLD